jgi:hypothetical protein
VEQFVIIPNGSGVVYRADQDRAGTFELYRVLFASPGVSTKLNPALPAGRRIIHSTVITPDSTRVLYTSDQETSNLFELYHVAFTSPGVSTKLNPTLPAGRFIGEPVTDNAAVVYSADQDIANASDLYRVSFANPGVSTRLTPPLPAGRSASGYVLTPDGTAVVYIADQDADNIFELYRVSFANPGVSTKLNGPLVAGSFPLEFCVNSKCGILEE